ncbi:hypothetical protein F5050DRAFT_757538, partial [Lentinula boryana]
MPLDGHSYLVAQGWSGKGNGLRKGAIAKPITVNQKKTLAGLGKDRDEAFPFWDHLFSAASQAITVKIDDSDASDTDEIHSSVAPVLRRTTTGILSNRRPVDVAPASSSGASTPDSSSSELRMSLIAMAKRGAAKRNLYSRFYRGAVLAPEAGTNELPGPASSTGTTPSVTASPFETLSNNPDPKGKRKGKEEDRDVDSKKEKKRKKRKIEEPEHDADVDKIENKTERRERKRRKKELKEMKAQMKEVPSEVRLKEKEEKKRRHGKLKDLPDDRSFPEISSAVLNAKDVLQNHEEKRRRKKEKERMKQQSKTEQPTKPKNRHKNLK